MQLNTELHVFLAQKYYEKKSLVQVNVELRVALQERHPPSKATKQKKDCKIPIKWYISKHEQREIWKKSHSYNHRKYSSHSQSIES